MTLFDAKRIERVVKLDGPVFKEIANDKDAMTEAVVIMLVASIIGSVWNIIFSFGFALIGIIIGVPIVWLIGTGILHLIAKAFGGKGTYEGYLKAIAYSQAPSALGIIPILGTLVGGLWSLACTVIATKEVHELTLGKAIVVVLVPLIIVGIIVIVLGILFFGMMGAMTNPYGY